MTVVHEAELRQALVGDVALSSGEWRWLMGRIERVQVAARSVLFAEGQPLDSVWFLLSGMVRYYARDKVRDRDVTFGFDYEGRLVSDRDALFGDGISRRSAEALENLDAFVLGKSLMAEACERDPAWERAIRRGHEKALLHAADKERRIRLLSPEERYRKLLDDRSPLALRLPQYHLASYLGVTPETLSRIRSRMRDRS